MVIPAMIRIVAIVARISAFMPPGSRSGDPLSIGTYPLLLSPQYGFSTEDIGMPLDDARRHCGAIPIAFADLPGLGDDYFVHVAPAPVFARLERLNDRMVRLLKVLRGMLVL
jgi:hypothetical protein